MHNGEYLIYPSPIEFGQQKVPDIFNGEYPEGLVVHPDIFWMAVMEQIETDQIEEIEAKAMMFGS
jgi:hypothetical protein